MVEEQTKPEVKEQKLEEKKPSEPIQNKETKSQDSESKQEQKSKSNPDETSKKSYDKKSEKKKEKPEVVKGPKKTEVVVNGKDIHVSNKVAVAICKFLKNKNIDRAIVELEQVGKLKRAIPMKGEIAHRRGRMMSGKYPVKAAGEFIRLLKSLKANAVYHELELERVRIACKANKAPRPYRRFGRAQFKRSHVEIRLVPITKTKRSKK